MSYEAFRQFADSYALAAMGIAWALFVGWAFRPGARARNRDAAHIIFEDNDDG